MKSLLIKAAVVAVAGVAVYAVKKKINKVQESKEAPVDDVIYAGMDEVVVEETVEDVVVEPNTTEEGIKVTVKDPIGLVKKVFGKKKAKDRVENTDEVKDSFLDKHYIRIMSFIYIVLIALGAYIAFDQGFKTAVKRGVA